MGRENPNVVSMETARKRTQALEFEKQREEALASLQEELYQKIVVEKKITEEDVYGTLEAIRKRDAI